MEKDLDVEAADPLELYQVEAGNYQVDLPEISLPVFKEDQAPEDDLSPVRDSITNGIPDKETLVEWIIARREKDLQANSYSVLAAALNEGEIPTLTGRANWSKGTIRNLVVRKKAEQD
jgi:ABC-type metal ion transport system substrate-binding protein